LVLQATGMARGGELFLLDMGEPVRIAELARQMIELSGLRVKDDLNPNGDIAIEYTGLRPGEKLFEELLISARDQPTHHPLIRKAKEPNHNSSELAPLIKALENALDRWDEEATINVLSQLVPEYNSVCRNGSATEKITVACQTNEQIIGRNFDASENLTSAP